MPETNTATPLPEPNPGQNNPTLTVVPAPETASRTRGEFNKEVEGELMRAAEICTAAQKPEYATALAGRGITPEFVKTLAGFILEAGQKSQRAVGCDSARKRAKQSEAAAEKSLVASLQTIQGAARVHHLPERPATLENYLVGERLNVSRPLLERHSQTIIDKAGEERPGGIDTTFLQNVQAQRTTYVNMTTTAGNEEAKAKQERASRDALLKKIVAQRKKIQYAADTLWPPRQPESMQARKEFKLPANRPYCY